MSHLTFNRLKLKLAAATNRVDVGVRYSHHKKPHHQYRLLGLAVLEENDEIAVRYVNIMNPDVEFIRPLDSWLAKVDIDGRKVSRFQKV